MTGQQAVIVRYESPADKGTRCSSLYIASCEPPADPEARIVIGQGRLLAEAHPEKAEWVFTAVGSKIIEIEATGGVR